MGVKKKVINCICVVMCLVLALVPTTFRADTVLLKGYNYGTYSVDGCIGQVNQYTGVDIEDFTETVTTIPFYYSLDADKRYYCKFEFVPAESFSAQVKVGDSTVDISSDTYWEHGFNAYVVIDGQRYEFIYSDGKYICEVTLDSVQASYFSLVVDFFVYCSYTTIGSNTIQFFQFLDCKYLSCAMYQLTDNDAMSSGENELNDSIKENTSVLDKIYNAIVNMFNSDSTDDKAVDDFENEVNDKTDELGNLTDDMDSVDKLEPEESVPDIKELVPVDDEGVVSSVFDAIMSNGYVVMALLVVFAFAFIGYVLFGKGG